MIYTNQQPKKHWPRRVLIIVLTGILLIGGATVAVRYTYAQNLEPLGPSQQVRLFTIAEGATVKEIAANLEKQHIIRSAWAFRLYVSSKEAGDNLKAGSYDLAQSQSVAEIVAQLTGGKVATNLVTILPGQRIDQVRNRLIQDGFSEKEVDDALDPAYYTAHSALVDKPKGASLEGYIYPDSYQRTASTTARTMILSSLREMERFLTPELRAAFAKQGLSTYQAVILASVVEKEVPKSSDRQQVAQVFLSRLHMGMKLESDATASYGAVLAGQRPSSKFDSVYNTYSYAGLTPTPISNFTIDSLKAVAYPANTEWLYFVSGDDGTTHFSKTLAGHTDNVKRYCTRACQ